MGKSNLNRNVYQNFDYSRNLLKKYESEKKVYQGKLKKNRS